MWSKGVQMAKYYTVWFNCNWAQLSVEETFGNSI